MVAVIVAAIVVLRCIAISSVHAALWHTPARRPSVLRSHGYLLGAAVPRRGCPFPLPLFPRSPVGHRRFPLPAFLPGCPLPAQRSEVGRVLLLAPLNSSAPWR